jgi:methylthioribulose-1-phosphate dehydratase
MADGLAAGGIAPAATQSDAVPGELAEALIAAGRRMDQRGWVPATSGNLSARMDGDRMAITRSGVHKGFLAPHDIIAVDFDGRSLTPGGKPSAETLLHCQIYRLWPEAGAVLHGHSVPATALTLALPGAHVIHLEGYEILKAWSAFATHEALIGYVLRGHGVYVWGADVTAALYRLEALEFLLATEIERRKLI